jgi:hypothetical protein
MASEYTYELDLGGDGNYQRFQSATRLHVRSILMVAGDPTPWYVTAIEWNPDATAARAAADPLPVAHLTAPRI